MIPEPSQEEMGTVRTEAGQASGLIVMATARTEAGHASGLIVLAWSVMYRLIRSSGRLRLRGSWVIVALFAHVALTTPGFAMQARREAADAPAQGTAGHSPPARAARGPVTKGATTGLPLPRYATLRADKVNLRRGPGTRYPIDWVFRRRHLPIRVIREYGPWRQIRTVDHVEGWFLGSCSARGGASSSPATTRDSAAVPTRPPARSPSWKPGSSAGWISAAAVMRGARWQWTGSAGSCSGPTSGAPSRANGLIDAARQPRARGGSPAPTRAPGRDRPRWTCLDGHASMDTPRWQPKPSRCSLRAVQAGRRSQ